MMARNRGNWLITGWRLRAPPIPSLGSFIRLVSPPCTPMYASPAVSGSLLSLVAVQAAVLSLVAVRQPRSGSPGTWRKDPSNCLEGQQTCLPHFAA